MTEKIKKFSPQKKARDTNFIAEIKNRCDGLFYISETDAEIVPFAGNKAEAVTKEILIRQIGAAADAPVEGINFDGFFARLSKIQSWFGEQEKQRAKKFGELKELLEENLDDLKVFKIGRIRLDIYAVGLDREGRLVGIETKAVET